MKIDLFQADLMRKTTLTPHRLIHVSARLACIILFFVWGYIFVSHLYWFLPPEATPPLWIWFGQSVHLVLLISYIIPFWNEKSGSIVMIVTAFVFFFLIISSGGTIAYFVISILPAILFFIASRMKKPDSREK